MLDQSFVVGYRRQRCMDATAELCVERGYRGMTVADIVARAQTSRNTFYDLFANREEVFVATFDRGFEELFAAVEGACVEASDDSGARLEAGLRAVLGWVAAEPASAWVCLIESFSTPQTFARHLDAMARFAVLLGANRPQQSSLPEAVNESLVGGVAAIISGQLRAGLATDAPQLLPNLVAFVHGPPPA